MAFKKARIKIGLIALMLLAACGSLPRGAGLQTEVLAEVDQPNTDGTEGTLPEEFAVEPITRDSLARYAGWPANHEKSYSWLDRAGGGRSTAVSPGDTVSISIWVSEDNSLLTTPGQRVVELPPSLVSPSGEVFLPYVGQTKISGKSVEEARRIVEDAYSAISSSAQVQLSVEAGRRSSVSLVGGVATPGPYPLSDSGVTVLDMLAAAGGVPETVVNPQIRLQRGDRTYGISMDRVLNDTELNATVVGGDRIYVEGDERYFLSLGAAGSKAQHHFPQDRVSALDALSIIGGLAEERANAQGILVLRTYGEKSIRADGSGPRHVRTIFTLDLTSADGLFSAGEFQIRSGDLIYVTESPLIGTRNIFAIVTSAFGLLARVDGLTN